MGPGDRVRVRESAEPLVAPVSVPLPVRHGYSGRMGTVVGAPSGVRREHARPGTVFVRLDGDGMIVGLDAGDLELAGIPAVRL